MKQLKYLYWIPRILGILYIGFLAIFSFLFFETYKVSLDFLLFSFPISLIGILFLLHNRMEVKGI